MKTEKLKGKFTYDEQVSHYEAVMKRPFNWLWLLLLLLLVPLFIRCEHDINVVVKDANGNRVENVALKLDYTAHFLFKDGFFTSEDVEQYGVTGSDGEYEFSDLPCSVWSYLFYCLSDVEVTASPDGWDPVTKTENFHYTSEIVFVLPPKPFSKQLQVIDKLTQNPIPDAEVAVTIDGDGKGTIQVNPDGTFTLEGLHEGEIVSLVAKAPGYYPNDSTVNKMPAQKIEDGKKIPLMKHYECNDNVEVSSKYMPVLDIPGIDMHQPSGTFTLDAYTYAWPDRIVVTNANGKTLLDTDFFTTDNMGLSPRVFTKIAFDTQTINIRVYSDPDHPTNSNWDIHPHCPD